MSKKETTEEPPRPELAKRRMNHKSSIKIGRTIAERREHLETANERAAFRKKDKIKKALRIILTIVGFIALIAILIGLYFNFRNAETRLEELNNSNPTPTPTVEIIDEASLSTGGHLTTRMIEFINQVSNSLRELGYKPTKAVIPTGSIREVRFYLDGRSGFIKTTIDRGAGVTAEDADRMLRYLADSGIEEFEYIDVRIDGKAYWK